MGEEEAAEAQARKAKEQQDQGGTDQRRVVGQTEMQVVPSLAAAHGEQRDLGFHGEPAREQGGGSGQQPVGLEALSHFIQRQVQAGKTKGVVQGRMRIQG